MQDNQKRAPPYFNKYFFPRVNEKHLGKVVTVQCCFKTSHSHGLLNTQGE